uniref:Uncharacterized protein n=1 Tax=Sphaerodactylus townsendi TaxID=933632 RepID=A0ACB8GDR8_9SAUR
MHRKGSGGRRAKDDGADSGAETGGAVTPRRGSAAEKVTSVDQCLIGLTPQSKNPDPYADLFFCFGEISVWNVRDPFLVSAHIIADPGESRALQQAIDNLLAWIHPDLQLFRVSERRIPRRPRKSDKAVNFQPALAVILFLQEEENEHPVVQLHKSFQRPPWRYHHTEQVRGNFLPYMPGGQDFFTMAQGTPLWAIRPVHYGKEIIRFTIYCSNENFDDIMKLYGLILRRQVCHERADFCIFLVYSNVDIDIQFSLKRLPRGRSPRPMDSSVLEFRVKDIGQLVPLLPNSCSPISEGRWQTEDPDGNKILLQVCVDISEMLSGITTGSDSAEGMCEPCLPPNAARTQGRRARTRVNVDDLEGVQETNVDTGMNLAFSDLSAASADSVPDRFSHDLEGTAKYPAQEHGVGTCEQAVSDGRSAKNSPFELPSISLPGPFAGSSSSSTSSSAASSGAHFEIKCLPRGTLVSCDDSRTTGGGKLVEEEFFI